VLKDIVKNLNRERVDIIKPLEKEQEQLTKSLKDLENWKNRVFELYEDGTIDKPTLAQRMENITADIDFQSKRRIQMQKELESIELHFDEKVQKYFINNKEGEASDDGGSPSFSVFSINI
jgi:hypothetical protein